MAADAGVTAATMRLDRFLWFARVVKKREWAQAMAAAGTLRIDGRRIERAAAAVRVGDTLTFMGAGDRVRVIRVLALPARRGPAAEARACYAELTPVGVAGGSENVSQEAAGD